MTSPFPATLDEHERAIEAECVPLDVPHGTLRYIHTALVALTRAQDCRLGWLETMYRDRAIDALRSAGRADLAERLTGRCVQSTDDVLSELWRMG